VRRARQMPVEHKFVRTVGSDSVIVAGVDPTDGVHPSATELVAESPQQLAVVGRAVHAPARPL
jgi:hypothetical protein